MAGLIISAVGQGGRRGVVQECSGHEQECRRKCGSLHRFRSRSVIRFNDSNDSPKIGLKTEESLFKIFAYYRTPQRTGPKLRAFNRLPLSHASMCLVAARDSLRGCSSFEVNESAKMSLCCPSTRIMSRLSVRLRHLDRPRSLSPLLLFTSFFGPRIVHALSLVCGGLHFHHKLTPSRYVAAWRSLLAYVHSESHVQQNMNTLQIFLKTL